MNLENIMPHERRQTQKDTYDMIPFIRPCSTSTERESKLVVVRGRREEKWLLMGDMIPFICPYSTSTETESKLVVVRDQGEEGKEVTTNGYGVSFWGDENVLEVDSGDGCTTVKY